MKARTLFLVALLGGLVLAPKQGAAQAAPAAGTPTILDVVVTDKADRPVAGLQAADFKVLENKQQRNVIGVRQVDGESPKADPPIQAYLLVDIVNTPFDSIATERKNIADYLKQRNGHLPVPTSLVFLTEPELKFRDSPRWTRMCSWITWRRIRLRNAHLRAGRLPGMGADAREGAPGVERTCAEAQRCAGTETGHLDQPRVGVVCECERSKVPQGTRGAL